MKFYNNFVNSEKLNFNSVYDFFGLGEISESEMINEILKLKGSKFEEFLDLLDFEQTIYFSKENKIYTKICRKLRNGGHKHEWCPVSRYIKFKEWGLSVKEIQKYVSKTNEVYFCMDGLVSKHGSGCSTLAHNEIFQLINESVNFEDYKIKLNKWANSNLTNKDGVITSNCFLPIELQV